MDGWLTIAEVAQQAGLAESTARRYADLFSDFLPARSYGRARKYPPEAPQVLARVAALYQAGAGTPEVRAQLQREIPRTINVEADEEREEQTNQELGELVPRRGVSAVHPQLLTILAAQQEMLQQIAGALDKLADQAEEIRNLRAQVEALREDREQQARHLEAALERRDQLLVERLRAELTKAKEQPAPWWRRLLGK